MKRHLYLSLIFVLLINSSVIAQLPIIQFKKFTTRDGLASSMVLTIIKDHYGFLWFGTIAGLSRYDGYQFRTFQHDPDDTTSISDNWIKCMFVSHNGNIWIGTHNGGLNSYNPQTEEFTSYSKSNGSYHGLLFDDINSLYEDDDGTLWIGTNGDGIYWKADTEKIFHHIIPDTLSTSNLSDNTIRSLCVDSKGNLWAGTTNGLYLSLKQEKYNGKFTKINLRLNKSKYSDITSICETWNGDVVIGSGDGCLYRYYINNKKIDIWYNPQGDTTEARESWITSIYEDKHKRLWVGTLNNGLRIFEPEKNLFYTLRHNNTDPASLISDIITSICEDDAGGIWIGTRDGVSFFDPRQKQFLNILYKPDNSDGISKGGVMGFCEDTNGNLWVGTHGGGLNYLPRGETSFKHFVHEPNNPWSISSDFIICMASYNDVIWLGTRGGGLNKFDKRTKKFTRYLNDPMDYNSLSENIIFCLDIDSKNNVWIGTSYNGVDMFDNKTGKFFHYRNKPTDSTTFWGKHTWSILVDNNDNVWVGTAGQGLNWLNRKTNKFTRFLNNQSDPQSLSNNYVSSLVEYPTGIFWIGTAGGGLNRYSEAEKSFKTFTEKEGLPDNQIISIVNDLNGRLWISSRKLTMFDPSTYLIKNYDERDGIKCGEFNQGAGYRGKDGKIYFGGSDGYVVFHPDSIHDNDYIPPVVITNFKVFEKSRKLPPDGSTGLTLSYDENYFSFEFAALSYTAPEKNMYRYKLEGYDRDWNFSGTRRYAAYTQVEPGDYVFKVQGSNNDGVWNTEGTSIAISIIPPFWKTIWFRLIAIFTLVFIITIVVRQRFKFLHKRARQQQELSRRLLESQEEERKRIGAGLHDSLGQDLLVIKNLAVMGIEACENNKKSDEHLKQISSLASQVLAELREISYNLRPYHLDQLGLTGALKSILSRVTSSSNIAFTEDFDDLNNLFPKEQEINIFRIVQEAVNNIIKHSHATEALIRIKREKDRVKFYISDNGIGFDAGHHGFGLSSMTERVRILEGSIDIKSEPGTGTTILINIPLRSKHAK